LVLSIKEEDGGLGEVTKAEGTPKETEYSWLLHQLPAIAHFQAARPAVVAALRTALQMETQPRAVASYIKFLATHALEDPLQDLADLTFDLAQLIVERSSLVSALLPSPSNRKRGAKTLECLIMLFWHYIQKVISFSLFNRCLNC
jgi:integrator complex subunit 1